MKKIGIILGILLILLPIVAAGNSYDADFSDSPTHLITLNENDEIRIFYKGTEHSVILDSINYEQGILNLEMFYDLKDYGYSTLYEGIMLRLDFGKDGTKEVGIELYDLGEDYATLLLTDLNYEEPSTTAQVTTDTEIGVVGQSNPWIKYIIFAVLIIVGILTFRLMKSNSSNNEETEEKTKTEIPDEVEEHEKEVESEEQDDSEDETEDVSDDEDEENSLEEE